MESRGCVSVKCPGARRQPDWRTAKELAKIEVKLRLHQGVLRDGKRQIHRLGDNRMLRTIFTIGLFAVLGLIALRFILGVLPAVVGMFLFLFWWAVKIALFGFVVYLIIRIVSPDTARRLREKWSGPAV
jgi:hypothetical protein